MQNMSLYKKGFNFDIFNKDESKEKNKEINCKTENNVNNSDNISDIFNDNELDNNNASQVEFYRQVLKEKKKSEEMFANEFRTVKKNVLLIH